MTRTVNPERSKSVVDLRRSSRRFILVKYYGVGRTLRMQSDTGLTAGVI